MQTRKPYGKSLHLHCTAGASVSDYRADVEAARAYSLTPEFQADRQRRPRVERFIAALVRYNGARRARRRGLVKADFQAKMNATAFRLRRQTLDALARPAPAVCHDLTQGGVCPVTELGEPE